MCRNVKRLMAAIMVFVMITSLGFLMTGCGESKENKGDVSTAAENTIASTESKDQLDPVKLTWFYIGDDQEDAPAVFDEANKIIQQKINATVDFQRFGFGDYDKKMQLKVASGEEFDLCYTADWTFFYNQNVAKGAFIELDKLIDQYAPGTKALIPEKIWNGTKINGKIWGVPNYQVSFRQPALIFKKDLVDKYNLKDAVMNIKKMADLTPIFDTIKKNEAEIVPSGVQPNWLKYDATTKDEYLDVVDFTIPVGIDSNLKVIDMNSDPKITAKIDEDYKLSREWYQKGFYHKDSTVAKDLTPEKQAGKFFVLEDVYKPGVESDMKARYGYDVYAVPIGLPVISTGSICATLDAISRTSENPERAMMLLELMNTDKALYNLIVFGQEGKHYTKESENRIKPVDGAKYSGYAWMMGCQFNAFLMPGQGDNVWEETKKLNMEATEAPTLGFSFDSSAVKTQIANIKSAREALINTANTYQDTSFILDAEQYKKKIAEIRGKVDKAGNKDFVTELQKQIDAWKAAK